MTMNHRSKIRQSALHYIYAKLQHGGKGFSEELFWEISLEKNQDHCRRTLAKLLSHLTRQSQDSFRLLEQRGESLMAACEADITTSLLRDELKRYLNHSSTMETMIVNLGHAMADKRQNDSQHLQDCNADLMDKALLVQSMAESIENMLLDRPAYRVYAEPFMAVMKRRTALCEHVSCLRHADRLPTTGEYKALVNAYNELAEIRPAAEELATKALEQQERWESLITPLLTNYSLERLDMLDKCTLFLMLYELKVLELPLPVVVSEATALAHSFSGGKSAPFIHGVLAAAAKVSELPEEA